MTRRTDLTTLRKYFSWKSIWFHTSAYHGLVVRDLVINTFLTGVCRRLGIVSGHFYIRTTIFNTTLIEGDMFFMHIERILNFWGQSKYTIPELIDMYDPIMDNSIHQMSSPFIGDVLYPSLKAYVFNFFKLVTFISRRLNIRFSNRLRLCIQMFPTLFSKSSLLNLSTSPIALFLSGNKVFDVFYQYLEYLSMHLLSYGIVKISGYDEVPYWTQRKMRDSYRKSKVPRAQIRRIIKVIVSDHTIRNAIKISKKSVGPSHLGVKLFKRCTSNSVCADNTVTLKRIAYQFERKQYFLVQTYFDILNRKPNFSVSHESHTTFSRALHTLIILGSPIGGQKRARTFRRLLRRSIRLVKRMLNTKVKKTFRLLYLYWIWKNVWLTFFNHRYLNSLKSVNVVNTIMLDTIYNKLLDMQSIIYARLRHIRSYEYCNSMYSHVTESFWFFSSYEAYDLWKLSFFTDALKILVCKIERSLISYTRTELFFNPALFLTKLPFITDSKMVCEFIRLHLISGLTITRAFKRLLRWQGSQYKYVRRKTRRIKCDIQSKSYKSTLQGIRLVCSGPPYKARRKMRKKYHLWLGREFITGRMPLQSFDFDIDYYQSYVRLNRASIGIKVWTLFERKEDAIFW